MKPFSFRLQKVLHYRTHLEKRVHLQLCEAAGKVKEQERRIVELGEARMNAAVRLADEREKGIGVCRDQLHTFFVHGLAERINAEGRELEKGLERLARVRDLLSIAATKKKSLECLKEVQIARFNEERERMEQKLLDDLMVVTRKRGEP